MREARPVEPPDWVLKGGLAHLLAPPLDHRPQTDHPLTLAGLMPITHKEPRSQQVLTAQIPVTDCLAPLSQKGLGMSL